MFSRATATAHIFRFALTFLLLSALAWAQSDTPQAAMTSVRTAPTSVPITPGRDNAAVRVMPVEDSAGGGPVDSGSGIEAADQAKATPIAAPVAGRSPGFEMLIGPGDLIEVSVYDAPDYVKEVRVRSTGEITLPLAGTLKIGGLTPAQAETLIAKRLSDGGFFNNPRVSVLEKEFATQGISVMGEVQKPGVYPLPGPRNLFDAISAAGGITARAGNTVSISHRSDPQHAQIVSLSEDSKSSSKNNVYVYPGDTIVVSKAGVVYVVGDVRTPGGFVMENSHMTMLQAFAMAQGANPDAALNKTQLIRRLGPENHPQQTFIELKKILTAKAPDMNLQAGDIVFVPTSTAKAASRRTLEAIVQTASGMAIYSGAIR